MSDSISRVAGKLLDSEKAILTAKYEKARTDEENRYREALAREERIYKANMSLLKEPYDKAMDALWDAYHAAGGRWDFNSRTGKFGMGTQK